MINEISVFSNMGSSRKPTQLLVTFVANFFVCKLLAHIVKIAIALDTYVNNLHSIHYTQLQLIQKMSM